MYQIQFQFIPGNSMIWVTKLNQNDPLYNYDNESDAIKQASILQESDNTGRIYKVVFVN